MADDAKNEEATIRHLIEAWASTVRAKDISDVIAYHTDDVLMFDVPPPVAVRGIAAYRETWPPFFDALAEGEAAFAIVELHVTAGIRLPLRWPCCDGGNAGSRQTWGRCAAGRWS
jgi:ketosteroid isomerase-like protein